jgi:hypothetical protein
MCDESAPNLIPSPVTLNFGSHLSPATAASLQIQAEAEYLRAYSQMQVDFAEARKLHAESVKLEGENSVQAVINKIRKREIIEADRAVRIGERLTKHRAHYEKMLEQLKFHPELSAKEINTGVALNFLKNRLSSSVAAYHAASSGTSSASEVARQLRITPEIRHALQVRQAVAYGESLVFRLDDGRSVQVDWWPPALRSPEVTPYRSTFEKLRNEVVQARTQEVFENKILELLVAHDKLDAAFINQEAYSFDKRRISSTAVNDYRDGKNMLRSLAAEIRRLQKVGRSESATSNLGFQGDNATDLLVHMVRTGLDFAPAKPGDEAAYQKVFHMLRDLYVAAEADAEKPEASTDAVIPEPPKRFPLNEPIK